MTHAPHTAIAIVGQACVLPGALDPDGLWRLAVENLSALTAVDPDRWGVSRERMLRGAGQSLADKSSSDIGGYVRGFDQVFDPEAYSIPAAELAGLDPAGSH